MKKDDLISRAAAIAEIEEYIEEYSELEPETGYHNLKWCAMEEAKDVLSMLPAVDAAPVVRCRDCRFAKVENNYGFDEVICYNEEFGPRYPIPVDWFCADGERRDDDG